MRHTAAMSAQAIGQFTERGFYLGEFRGRTLGFVLQPAGEPNATALAPVLAELMKHDIRVILLTRAAHHAAELGAPSVAVTGSEPWPAHVWRKLGDGGCTGLVVPEGSFEAGVRAAALRLGLGKLVWLRAAGGLRTPEGTAISFMDAEQLGQYRLDDGVDERDAPLLAEIEALLEGGIPSVNLCSAEGLDDELFTYAGSGTLFTRERYADVRTLAVDEFDAAGDLIARGVAEGYLVERDRPALDRILAGGIGVFIDGRHLAGVGALLPHPDARAAEIASLYTVTRYLGGGIGHQIVRFAVSRARATGLEYVFACTTSDRVATFFEGSGFRRVGGQDIPEAKWRGYPSERRDRLVCLRMDLRMDLDD